MNLVGFWWYSRTELCFVLFEVFENLVGSCGVLVLEAECSCMMVWSLRGQSVWLVPPDRMGILMWDLVVVQFSWK